jgi:hypothetical protein
MTPAPLSKKVLGFLEVYKKIILIDILAIDHFIHINSGLLTSTWQF